MPETTKTRMKVTLVGYYDAEPQHYEGETDPRAMAAIDQRNIEVDPVVAVSMMEDGLPFHVTVEPA